MKRRTTAANHPSPAYPRHITIKARRVVFCAACAVWADYCARAETERREQHGGVEVPTGGHNSRPKVPRCLGGYSCAHHEVRVSVQEGYFTVGSSCRVLNEVMNK